MFNEELFPYSRTVLVDDPLASFEKFRITDNYVHFKMNPLRIPDTTMSDEERFFDYVGCANRMPVDETSYRSLRNLDQTIYSRKSWSDGHFVDTPGDTFGVETLKGLGPWCSVMARLVLIDDRLVLSLLCRDATQENGTLDMVIRECL